VQGHPYRNVIGLRSGASTSLIQVALSSHVADTGPAGDRIPQGLPYWTLNAQMRELEIFFLYRFLQVLLSPFLEVTPISPSRRGCLQVCLVCVNRFSVSIASPYLRCACLALSLTGAQSKTFPGRRLIEALLESGCTGDFAVYIPDAAIAARVCTEARVARRRAQPEPVIGRTL
jgi:hypothetical protein